MDDQVTREQDLDLESDKVVLLNSTQICLIFECFKTTVEIGPISKRSTISQPKRVIKLTGTQSNIEKAKPEVSVSISINNSIGDKVRSPSFTQQLIRQYPLTFQIHNNNTMKLKGHRDEVYAAEKYLKSLEKQQQSSNKMDFDDDDNDGSVICLSDPYEAFADDDDIVDKPTAKNKTTTTSKKKESTDKQAKEVAGRNQAASSLRSNRVESNDDSVICIDDGDGDKKTQFRSSAVVRGFTSKQVDQVFSELNDKVNSMSETQFIQHLKNKFKTDSRTISESDQNPVEKANKKPVIKQQQQTTSTPIPNKQLTEYAKLVEMQKFDLKHEEENKMGRISALINAMDSKDAKVDAMGKVLKYKEATSKKSSTNKGTIASRLVTDEEETSNSLLGYTAMMMDEEENNKHQPANNSSILPGYETMMMDEEEDKPTTTKTATSKKPIASSPSKNIRPKSFLEEAAKMKKIQSDTNELQIIDDAKMTKPSRNENISKNQNNQNTKKATESASAAAIANKPIQEAAVAEINELDKAMKELSNRQDIKDPLRYIIIDGSNVAMEHGIQTNGGQQVFSCMGIQIVVDHFIKRGHKNVKAFVPRFRRGMSDRRCPTTQGEILDELDKRGNLIYTPSRFVGSQLICPYDDRFILRAAQHYNAVIVSNDNYRDLRQENAEWDHLVKYNLLQYSFLGDLFMIADDPMGRHGPTIDEFLSNSSNKTNKGNNHQQQQRNQFHPVLSSGQMKTSATFGGAHNFHSNNNFKSYDSTHKSNNNNRNGMSKMGSWSNLADTNYQTRSKQFNNPTNDFPRMASNTNNSNTGSYHAKGNKPRDSSSSRRGKKGRDMNENSTLYSGLLDIFPKSDAKIKQLLSDPSHSSERDLMFFANKILESNSNLP